jgi:hypothetical protein
MVVSASMSAVATLLAAAILVYAPAVEAPSSVPSPCPCVYDKSIISGPWTIDMSLCASGECDENCETMTSGCSIATWIYYDNTLGASDVFVMAHYGGASTGHYVHAGEYDQWYFAYDNLPCGDEIRLTGGDGLAWLECLDCGQ